MSMTAQGTGVRVSRISEAWQTVLPLLAGATLAATLGCLIIPALTRSPVGFASTFLRYQLAAVPAAWLAVLVLGVALCADGVTERRVRMLALAELVLFGVAGGVFGAFAGSVALGLVVFLLPAGVVFLGALAGRAFFRAHPGVGYTVTAVCSGLAVLGLVTVIAGW